MKLRFAGDFRFGITTASGRRQRGVCRIEAAKLGNGVFCVMMTEKQEANSLSITNACDRIATQAYAGFLAGITPEKIVWLEHYPRFRKNPAYVDMVEFQYEQLPPENEKDPGHPLYVFSAPRWTRIFDASVIISSEFIGTYESILQELPGASSFQTVSDRKNFLWRIFSTPEGYLLISSNPSVPVFPGKFSESSLGELLASYDAFFPAGRSAVERFRSELAKRAREKDDEYVSLREKFRGLSGLPTLSVVQSRIISVLRNENATIDDLAEVIRHDQSLASKIVSVANSAFFGCLRKVDSIEHAILMLGYDYIKGIALSVCVFGLFPRNEAVQTMWAHAYGVASLAGMMIARRNPDESGTAFLAGLLHDIGIAGLMQVFKGSVPARADREFLDLRGESLISKELEFFRCGHSLAGAWLLEGMSFAEEIIMPVRCHHNHDADTIPEGLAASVFLSEGMIGMLSETLAGDGEWTGTHGTVFAREGFGVTDMQDFSSFFAQEEKTIQQFFGIRNGERSS